MMSCVKDSLYMANSVNNGQNALDGKSLKVVMIWQKDNPIQAAPKGKSDLCCHYLPP